MGTTNIQPPGPGHPLHELRLIEQRLESLTVEELAHLGRPNGPPARFLRVDGDMFVYQVMAKRVPAIHGDAAREMLQRGAKAGESKVEFQARLANEFSTMRTVQTCLKRTTVARNATHRIKIALVSEIPQNKVDTPELEGYSPPQRDGAVR